MDAIKYGYADGYSSNGVPADVAARELKKLKEQHGELSASLVLEAARDKRCPFRAAVFDLNKADAAESYYLSRARALLMAVTVKYEESPETPTRLFHVRYQSSPDPKRRAIGIYDSLDAILADPVARASLLDRALREAESWQRRYAKLDELAAVFDSINDARKAVGE